MEVLCFSIVDPIIGQLYCHCVHCTYGWVRWGTRKAFYCIGLERHCPIFNAQKRLSSIHSESTATKSFSESTSKYSNETDINNEYAIAEVEEAQSLVLDFLKLEAMYLNNENVYITLFYG